MDIYESVNLQDCPLCEGPALLEEEENNVLYVTCLDCGCHTVGFRFHNDEEKLDAANRVAYLWNVGKVISCSPGE